MAGSYGSSRGTKAARRVSRQPTLAACKTLASKRGLAKGLLTHIFDGFHASCDRRPLGGSSHPGLDSIDRNPKLVPLPALPTIGGSLLPGTCDDEYSTCWPPACQLQRTALPLLPGSPPHSSGGASWAALAPRRPRAVSRGSGDATGEKTNRSVRWTAAAAVSAPCHDRMQAYLRQMDAELLVRLDDSVEAVEPLGGNRYRADISKVGFFGLLACRPVATLRVERTDRGIRYVTEKCDMVFSGPLRRLVAGLAGIGVEACTELSARDGTLSATGDFALTLPLPRWWPVPDRAMARGEGMIRGIVAKDTRLTVERLISSVS